jgi:hypothetical protein
MEPAWFGFRFMVWGWVIVIGPLFWGAIEPQMRLFGRNGCSDFLTSYEWSQPMRFGEVGRLQILGLR